MTPPTPPPDDVDGLLRLLAAYQDAHVDYRSCINSYEDIPAYFCKRYAIALETATAAFAAGLGAVIDRRVDIRLQALGVIPSPLTPIPLQE